jgi:hypothetical protein
VNSIDRIDRWMAWGLAAGALLFFLPGLFWGLPGGKSINGALQILDGRVPYRDFWTMYAPGMFYLTAGVFKLFGFEVVFQGAVLLLIKTAIPAVYYLLVRRLGLPRLPAISLSLIIAAAMWGVQLEIKSYYPALLLLLISLTLVVRYLQEGSGRRLVWAGVWAGLAACFKHDVAAYVTLAIAIGLVLSWMLAKGRRPDQWLAPVKAITYLALGTCVFFIPVAALVAFNAGPDAWQDLIVFPGTDFRKVRGERYPPVLPRFDGLLEWLELGGLRRGRAAFNHLSQWALCYLPQYVFLVACAVLVTKWRQLNSAALASVLTILAAMPFFWMAAHVQRNTHLMSMAILSGLLGAIAWGRLKKPMPSWTKVSMVALASVYGMALLISPLMQAYLIRIQWPERQTLDLPGVRWLRLPQRDYEVYEPIGSFLRERTRSDEFIFSGVEKHDAIVINNPKFHYLADRLSCCRYGELHPGITDRLEQQQEIIRDIERHEVRAMVIWAFGWPDSVLNEIKERRMAAVPGIGATLLNEYIANRFTPVMARDEYTVMWRTDLVQRDGLTALDRDTEASVEAGRTP